MATTQSGFQWLVAVLVAVFVMHVASGELLVLLDGSPSNDSDAMGNSTGNSSDTDGGGGGGVGRFFDVKMYSKEISNDSCIPFSRSWRMDDLPAGVAGDPAGSPEDVFVSFIDQDGDLTNETFIRVGWRPDLLGIDNIKGFLLVFESQMSKHMSCFIAMLNMSLLSTLQLNGDDYFYYDFLEALSSNEDYLVFVSNLPPMDTMPMLPKDPVVLLRTGFFSNNQETPEYARWSPNVAVRKSHGMSATQVEVRFTENRALSPSRKYTIGLRRKSEAETEESISDFELTCSMPEMIRECVAIVDIAEPEFAVRITANDDMCNGSCLATETSYFKIELPVVIEKTTTLSTVPTTPMVATTIPMTTIPSTTEKMTMYVTTTLRLIPTIRTEEVPTRLETTIMVTLPTSTLLAVIEPISSYKRANHTLVGGLLGGLTAAGLFTLVVVVFALMDRGKSNKKSSKKKDGH